MKIIFDVDIKWNKNGGDKYEADIVIKSNPDNTNLNKIQLPLEIGGNYIIRFEDGCLYTKIESRTLTGIMKKLEKIQKEIEKNL